jgi:DNA-binding CsgD family transcriptional regulator
MQTQIEYWENIYYKGEKLNYQISTRGRVKNVNTQKLVTQYITNSGYYRVSIMISNTEHKNFSVHRLMGIAFIPIPKRYIKLGMDYDDLDINHKDGKKLHNDCYNLEWLTRRENTIDAILNGLCGYLGENSHLAKMDEKTARKCCEMLQDGKTTTEISEKLGISKKSAQHIKDGTTWRHIAKDYTFKRIGKAIPNTMSEEDIHEMCKMIATRKYIDKEIAAKFGVSREYVRDIRNGKRRRNISSLYFTID